MPFPQNAAYTVAGVVGSIATSVALLVPTVVVNFVQLVPLLVLRYRPVVVAANSRAGVPGVTAMRQKRAARKVGVASAVHESPPSVERSTTFPSPVPAYSTRRLDGSISSAPMASDTSLSDFATQLRPPSVFFHTPPCAMPM